MNPAPTAACREHDLNTVTDEEAGWEATFRSAGPAEVLMKMGLGIVFSASALPILPVLVMGWLTRLMRRRIRVYWMRRITEVRELSDFEPTAGAVGKGPCRSAWPNWLMADDLTGEASLSNRGAMRFLRRCFGGGVQNFKAGLAALAGAWVLTLPAGALWTFSWYAGWNNSFNKGYEQAAVGPLTGLAGVALFIAAMNFLPLAHARQASAGTWKAFFDYRAVRGVIRTRRPACVGLAFCYALFGMVLLVLLVLPGFIEGFYPAATEMSRPELRALTRRYYLGVAAFGFPCLMMLKLLAARIYAQGMLTLSREEAGRLLLSDREREFFDRYAPAGGVGFLTTKRKRSPGLAGVVLRPIGFVAPLATAACWFAFAAQIYLSQFLYFKSFAGWLNHPWIQLPRFFYWP